MASTLLPCSITSPRFSSCPILVGKPPHFSPTPTRRFALSCTAGGSGGHRKDSPQFDRREMLLGLGAAGGLYSSVAASSAEPIPQQVLDKCTPATDLATGSPVDFNCCPPGSSSGPLPYVLPNPPGKPLFRPALHLASPEYIKKLEQAIQAAKDLSTKDPNDPRGFSQQANVHCAFCNLAYPQSPGSDLKLQIHFSWYFFPWHRWYLYFYERILGKLIGDPTFALPFWNWDNPKGMTYPDSVKKSDSPLYNPRRNTSHYPLTPDLQYNGTTSTKSADQIIRCNLAEMYTEMISGAKTLENFYGGKYVVGSDNVSRLGTVEGGSHTALHRWVGEDNREGFDMGNFATAGKEVLFFAHHANIDRLWSVWRNYRDNLSKPSYFNEPDWLDAKFVFYDENANLVTVRNGDSLDYEKMGFTWQDVPNPWLDAKPPALKKKSTFAKSAKAPKSTDSTIFPVKLDKVVRVLVDRPKKRRSAKEKDKEEEELLIEGIDVEGSEFVRFEVFVNDEDVKPEELIGKAEYAGCYSQVPLTKPGRIKGVLKLGLSELLEELDIEDDDKILVSIVPRGGGKFITIGGIKIVYDDI